MRRRIRIGYFTEGFETAQAPVRRLLWLCQEHSDTFEVFIFYRIWDASYSFGLQQFVDAGAKVWHSGDHKELLWIINDCSLASYVYGAC
jgi:hypothetical protein